jgi:hypothetical protein
MRYYAAQPGARPTVGIENRNGTCACPLQVGELFRDEGPETAIRVAMETIEAEQSFRVPVRVSDIIIAGLIVDGGYLAAGRSRAPAKLWDVVRVKIRRRRREV